MVVPTSHVSQKIVSDVKETFLRSHKQSFIPFEYLFFTVALLELLDINIRDFKTVVYCSIFIQKS